MSVQTVCTKHNVNVVEPDDNEVVNSEHDDEDRNKNLAEVNEDALSEHDYCFLQPASGRGPLYQP